MRIISGEKSTEEANKIHEENIEKIQNMKLEEIIEARNELMQNVDPKLIDFLSNKVKKQTTEDDINTKPVDLMKIDSTVEKNNLNDLNLLERPDSKKWLNMNSIENEKLEWMKPIPNTELFLPENKSQVNEARFHFDGSIILNPTAIKTHEGLHHHGDDPDRPGYTINELLTLLHSEIPSQRILSLQVIGNIMEINHKGSFDLCFTFPLAKELFENTSLLLIVRKCLDDKSETLITAGIHCLHGLICNNEIDEIILDRIYPWIVSPFSPKIPQLKPNHRISKDKIEETKDEDLIKVDVIEGLIRTDLLERLRYLLDFHFKSGDDHRIIQKLFDIAIRIARHSPTTCSKFISTPFFLETTITNFLPAAFSIYSDKVYGNPFPKAIKLLRIIFSTCKDSVQKIFRDFPVLWNSLQEYLIIDPSIISEVSSRFKKCDVLQTSIETLRIWHCLLSSSCKSGEAFHKIEELFPILLRQLQFVATLNLNHKNLYDWHYSSNLIICITSLAENDPRVTKAFSSLLETIVFQLMGEITKSDTIPCQDILTTISCGIHYLVKFSPEKLYEYCLKPFMSLPSLMKKLSNQLIECSPILRLLRRDFSETDSRDSTSLPSFRSLYFGGQFTEINSLLRSDSVLVLFSSLIEILEQQKQTIVQQFLRNQDIKNYVQEIMKNFRRSSFSYYEFFEMNALVYLPKIISEDLDSFDIYFNLSRLLLVYAENNELKLSVVSSVIFNSQLYQDLVSTDLETGNKIKIIYKTYKKYSKFDSKMWMFDPILESFHQNEVDLGDIINCLTFIDFTLKNRHKFIFYNSLNSSDIFICVSATFLLTSDIFFEEAVVNYLNSILNRLLEDGFELNSRSNCHISGYNSVMSYFDAFIQHYDGVSYGEPTFANYLLAFLRQKSDREFKIKLLSENWTVCRAIIIPINQIKYDVREFLYPIEDSLEIIQFYIRILLSKSIRKESNYLLYLMAIHHVYHNLFGSNASKNQLNQSVLFNKLKFSIEKSSDVSLKTDILNCSS